MSDLTVRAIFTADNARLLDATKEVTAAQNALKGSTSGVSAAGKTLTADAAALAAQHAETEQATQKLGVAIEHMGREAGIGRERIAALRASFSAFPALVTLIGPVGIAMLGVTAAIGLAIVAEQAFEASADKVTNAASAQGNALGQTREQYLALSSVIAGSADVSERSARTIAASFINAGIDPSLWDELSVAAAGYAVATGEDIPKAAGELADALRDPIKDAQELADKWDLFDEKTLKLIRDLSEQGDKLGATKIIVDALAERMGNLAGKTSGASRAFHDLSTWASNVGDTFGKWVDARVDEAYAGNAKFGGGTLGSDNVTLDLTPSPADQKLADQKRTEGVAVGGIVDQYDPYNKQLSTLKNQRLRVQTDQSKGLIDAGEATKALALIKQQEAKVTKEQTDAELNLNETLKAKMERIKQLINGAPQMLAQAKLAADDAIAEANAVNLSTLAHQKMTDQMAISKATLPYATSLLNAHGTAAAKLRAIIDGLTKSMIAQQAAQHYTADVTDIRSRLGSASTANLDVGAAGQLADDQSALARKNLDEQFALTQKNIDDYHSANPEQTKAEYADLVRYLQEIYNDDLAQLYLDDLSRRKDWQSGIERSLIELKNSTQDWAKTSSSLVDGFAKTFEDDFVKAALTGKNTFGDFMTYVEEQLLKLAYEKYLAPTMNGLFGNIVGGIGDAFGLGGSGSTDIFSSIFGGLHSGGRVGADAPMSFQVDPAVFIGAPHFHSGGTVGGLKPGDRPIIAQDGETVLTENQTAATIAALSRPILVQAPAATAMPKVVLNVQTPAGTKTTASEPKQMPNGDIQINALVEQVDGALQQKQRSGQSLFGREIANNHGLTRRPS